MNGRRCRNVYETTRGGSCETDGVGDGMKGRREIDDANHTMHGMRGVGREYGREIGCVQG